MSDRSAQPRPADPLAPAPSAELAERIERGEAVAWSAPITVPTYEPEPPTAVPMYFDRRVYQGSSGRVYPLPFIERISPEPVDRVWQAIHLENRYLRLVVLPELGGRIHVGFDKSTGYDFFYRNRVIKPALVGLTGPWISGGVEFNWPQHHRPATFLPVEWQIEEHEDGAVTVWCGDHDPFERMAGVHGVRIHPDRSTVETVVRLHNRTSLRQSFLWWANAAVRVHDRYQSFFPQDVRYVADHARRAITAFPAADRPYYGVDYPTRAAEHPGADRIDFYRNIPVPTSYMVVDSTQQFFGGYDHAVGAGFVHCADRRISPGKKQWTWGDAPFGRAWDRLLTDEDGPYIELMAGVYTENQPDFSWLLPGEVKRFTQTWYPIPQIGPAHQATPRGALHVAFPESRIAVAAAVTRPGTVRLTIRSGERLLAARVYDAGPGQALHLDTDMPIDADPSGIAVELVEAGQVLVDWKLVHGADEEPWIASEPPAPDTITSVEQLYLTGLHLEQYRHPTRSPEPYWTRALELDPGESRVHTALGWRAFRRGSYAVSEGHARSAIARLSSRNENPQSTEAHYLLGLVLARTGRTAEAIQVLGKASWDATWRGPAGVESVRLLAAAGEVGRALTEAFALADDGHDQPRLVALRAILGTSVGGAANDDLRRLRDDRPVDHLARYLHDGAIPAAGGLALDLAADLAAAGAVEDAAVVLEQAAGSPIGAAGNVRPVALYLLAGIAAKAGRAGDASELRQRARDADRRWCMPAGLDAHDALVDAIVADPTDGVAGLLLGMLLYGVGRRRDALDVWRAAAATGLDDAVLYRNLGLAEFTVSGDGRQAWAEYLLARTVDPADPRLLFEQDQLAERRGHRLGDRLARLDAEPALVDLRDDLTIVRAELLIAVGRAHEALALIEGREFQPWEGGEGRVLAAWDAACAAVGLPGGDPPASLGKPDR